MARLDAALNLLLGGHQRRRNSAQPPEPFSLLLTSLLFCLVVVSFERHQVSALLPLACFPLYLYGRSHGSGRRLCLQLALASPFVVLLALSQPLVEQESFTLLNRQLSSGWLTALSLMIRFVLTSATALLLVDIVGLPVLSAALHRLGLPAIVCQQLLLLHRYLFVLLEETVALRQAAQLRGFGQRLTLSTGGNLLGQLLLRSLLRSRQIHNALLSRHQSGHLPLPSLPTPGWQSLLQLFSWSALFMVLRSTALPQWLGRLGAWS